MAKKKAKKGDKVKGRKRVGKLPKSVAEVTIPKDLRNSIEPVLSWAGSPPVSEALAAALLAGASALTATENHGDSTAKARPRALGTRGGSSNGGGIGLAIALAAGGI